MKIIIQQKPNLEGGFGFKLNIGPGRTIVVEKVTKRGSADKCGLKKGDEVELVNDHPCQVFSLRELDDIVKSAVYSGNISLMIQRAQEPTENKENELTTSGYKFRPKSEQHEEKANPFKSNSSLSSSHTNTDNALPPVPTTTAAALPTTTINSDQQQTEEKWLKELGLYDTQNIQRIQTLDLRNNKLVTEQAQKIVEPVVREKVSNNSGGSFYSSESGPTGSGGSTGDQKQLSPKSRFQVMDAQFEESIKSEERELMKKRHERELEDQRRRQEYEDKLANEEQIRRQFSYQRKVNKSNHVTRIGAIERMEEAITRAHRMELEAKEAEQRARQNREEYDDQMQRIEEELKLEEARLAQVRDQRVQAEQQLKTRYNYNADYSVIYPPSVQAEMKQQKSKIHDVPDIPSPHRSYHNSNNKTSQPKHHEKQPPRYYFQDNQNNSSKYGSTIYQPKSQVEKSDSVENILNDPNLQATLL